MIKITCVKCGMKLEAPDEAAGNKGKCPYCETVFEVLTALEETSTVTIIPKAKQEDDVLPEEGMVQREKHQPEKQNKGAFFEDKMESAYDKNGEDMEESKAKELLAEGNSEFENCRFQEAIKCFDKVLEISPTEASAWSGKGASLCSLGDFSESVVCYDRAAELTPHDVVFWVDKGIIMINYGNIKEALSSFEKALQLDSQCVEALEGLGYVSLHLNKNEESLAYLNAALQIDAENTNALGLKGIALARTGRFDEAVPCLEKATEEDVKDAAFWTYKGRALDMLGRAPEAVVCFNEALKIEEPDSDFLVWQANALINTGCTNEKIDNNLLEKAVACYDKALELEKQNPEAWYGKGLVLFIIASQQFSIDFPENDDKATMSMRIDTGDLDKYEESLSCFNHALAILEENAPSVVWSGKGFALYRLGEEQEASNCIRKALSMDPDDHMANQCLEEMQANEKFLNEDVISKKESDWVYRDYEFLSGAINNHDVDRVKELLKMDETNINELQAGLTPLQRSIVAGDLEIFNILMRHGPDIHKSADPKWNAMHMAVHYGHLKMVEVLIAHGADVHETSKMGITFLHRAAASGNVELVKFLIEKGLDINACAKYRKVDNPLSRALNKKHVGVVKLLLNYGADDSVLHEVDKRGYTHLDKAEFYGDEELKELLIAHKVKKRGMDVQNEIMPYTCECGKQHALQNPGIEVDGLGRKRIVHRGVCDCGMQYSIFADL